MVNIRVATIQDLAEIQNTNLQCLPENYQMKSERECAEPPAQSQQRR